MVGIGYGLLMEEHPAPDLVALARRAEEAGFQFAGISDHYHPWTDSQGHSSFVWAVLGAIAQATDRLVVGTGVTCPTMRIHPAIIAQASASVAALMPGRFFLGVGTGENLNEHVLGDRWPPIAERREMLEEAIEVIRLLWQGGTQSHGGVHYRVEDARVYCLPEELPPIMVAAGGPLVGRLAARAGDGMIVTKPDADLVETFRMAGGSGPVIGMLHLCWAESEAEARRTALHRWPNAALSGMLGQDLRLPRDFEAATSLVREDDLAERVPLGPDPDPIEEQIRAYADAGCEYVYLHQIGPEREGFFRFYERELAPRLRPDEAAPERLARVAA